MKLVFLILLMVPTAYAGSVHLIKRTYTNLRNLDLGECKQSYRFLNDNWMDCHFKLPENKQVSPANLPILSHSFSTDQEGITAEIDIRTFTHSYEEASLETSMWVSVSYRKSGDFHIHSMPKEYYSPKIIKDLIKKAFTLSDKKGTLTTTLLGVPENNKWAEEKSLKKVLVGLRTVTPDINECEKTYKVEMSDSWPEEDHPFSMCVVKNGIERQSLPLSESFWSSKLKKYKNTFSINEILFSIYNGQYSILVSENQDIPFAKAENDIKRAINELGSKEIVFTIFEDELNTLQSNEKIMGQLEYEKKIISSSEDTASEASLKYLYP